MNASIKPSAEPPGRPSVKPSAAELGIDLDAPTSPPAPAWRRSGTGSGAIEVAFVAANGRDWVLMRVAGDPVGRVLVYDHHEWECFIDGAKKGEFDHAAAAAGDRGAAPDAALEAGTRGRT